MPPKYVFLTEVSDFAEAQVVKSLLEGMHLHPRFHDEQMRTIASHLGPALGKLVIEIPEDEFMKASQALENLQAEFRANQEATPEDVEQENLLVTSQELAKKALLSAIIGCVFLPVIANLYSMMQGYRVLQAEHPLSSISRRRLLWAIAFNALAFYIWLALGPKYFFHYK